jgi:hypothetical protein
VTERLWPAGVLRVPAGTCPGCAGDSHPGTTCDGKTTDEVWRALWPEQEPGRPDLYPGRLEAVTP